MISEEIVHSVTISEFQNYSLKIDKRLQKYNV